MGWPIHRPVGLTHLDPARASRGYTLIAPAGGEFALLLDMQGRAVHRWDFQGCVGFNVELLPNGNLLALCGDLPARRFPGRRFRASKSSRPTRLSSIGSWAAAAHRCASSTGTVTSCR